MSKLTIKFLTFLREYLNFLDFLLNYYYYFYLLSQLFDDQLKLSLVLFAHPMKLYRKGKGNKMNINQMDKNDWNDEEKKKEKNIR